MVKLFQYTNYIDYNELINKPLINKVVVEGVAIVKKHQKPNNENPQGAIVEKEAPIHVSNVQVLDKNGVAGRVGYKVVDGKKVRYNKKSGEVLD